MRSPGHAACSPPSRGAPSSRGTSPLPCPTAPGAPTSTSGRSRSYPRTTRSTLAGLADVAASGAPVVTRTTFGKWGPELAAATRDAGELVLAGVATDCCVISTALAAADAGRRVLVVADACAGSTAENHQRALEVMRLYAPLIEVTTIEGVLGTATP
ncbi:cysteine hydrolase family protein [Promicromonospora soli]